MTRTNRMKGLRWPSWRIRLGRRGWNALRVVLFFAVSGAILGVAAYVTPYAYHEIVDPPESRGFVWGPLKRWAFLDLAVITGSIVGFVWGALCSIVAVRRLRGKVIWKAACWVVPTCVAVVVVVGLAVELTFPAPSKLLRWVALLFGSPLLTLWFVGLAHRLPEIMPPGYCKACAYDLTGNVSGVCPECGETVPKGELVCGSHDWPGGWDMKSNRAR